MLKIGSNLITTLNAGAVEIQRIHAGANLVYENAVFVDPSLMAWYKAENDALDSTINGNDATEGTATAYGAGFDGQAFDFGTDGTTGGLPNTGLLTPSFNLSASYAIEFYCKRYENFGNTYHHLISNAYDETVNFGALYWVNAGIQYWHGGGNPVSSTQGLEMNTWYKVRYEYNAATQKSKIRLNDDALTPQIEGGTHSETFAQAVGIGRSNPMESRIFNGLIDDVKFFNLS